MKKTVQGTRSETEEESAITLLKRFHIQILNHCEKQFRNKKCPQNHTKNFAGTPPL